MTAFANVYKRSRPMLGTFLSIALERAEIFPNECQYDEAINEVFHQAVCLEQIFSGFDANSTLCRVNRAELHVAIKVDRDFFDLLKWALGLWQESKGAFNPFLSVQWDLSFAPFEFVDQDHELLIYKKVSVQLDLNGIAKGYIVDRAVEDLRKRLPSTSGVVNAGGDLRFFNCQNRSVHLRLGDSQAPVFRALSLPMDCVATSSISISLEREDSSSCYSGQLRAGLTPSHSVSVIGTSCWIADGLTKVALYGDHGTISHCANHFGSQVLVFDPDGSLAESFGVI